MPNIHVTTRIVVPSNGAQVAFRCPLPLQVRQVRTVGPANHQFSLSLRANTGNVISISSFFQSGDNKLAVRTKDRHDWQEGDKVVVSGSSRAAYNTTHEVADVLGDYVAVFATAFAGEAVGGTGQYTLDDDLKFLYGLIPTQTASGSRGQWDGDVVAVNMDKLAGRSAASSSHVLYLTASLAGTYLVSIRGITFYGFG